MFINIKGKKIYFELRGSGPSLVWIHGWGGNSKSLANLHKLASKKYKSLIIDLPGFGRSENPESDWGVKEYAEVVIGIIKKLKLNPVIYFGHSFGGGLGIYIAATHPELISKLILCAPSYRRNVRKHWITKTPFYFLFKNTFTPFKRLLYRAFLKRSDSLRFQHLESNYRKIITEDQRENVRKIKLPSLILWGDKDQAVTIKDGFALARNIPNSKIKVFKGHRHNLPLIALEEVFEEIDKFVVEEWT